MLALPKPPRFLTVPALGHNLRRRCVRLARDGAIEMDAEKPLRAEALSEVQRLQRELKRVTMARIRVVP